MSGLARVFAWLLALALVALPGIALLQGWLASERWPLSRLVVAAEFERVSPEQVRSALAEHAAAGFFAVDLVAARTGLEQLPWVRSAEVRKRWPDTLEIELTEHRAFARWGEKRLISELGAVFEAPGGQWMEGLPHLDGPEERRMDVIRVYREATARLRGTGLGIDRLRLSPRGSWSLSTSDGARWMVGRGEPTARIERFARLLPAVLADGAGEIERADLRYANGFAIRWRRPEPSPQSVETT